MVDTRRFSRHVWREGDPRASAAGRKGRLSSHWNTTSGVDTPKAIRLNAEYQRRMRGEAPPESPRDRRLRLIREAAARIK